MSVPLVTRRSVTMLPAPRPHILAVGTSTPETAYEQEWIADMLGIPDGLGRRFFRTSGIETRYLSVPLDGDVIAEEDQGMLLARHRRRSLELGRTAVSRCLTAANLRPDEVDFLCCVSSTGFMMPGLTAMYIRHLGMRPDCARIDIVGMGCNAALNGLNTVTSWLVANPGRIALLVCCEINSAIYVRDELPVTSLVNSLFGDGCGAWVVSSRADDASGPEVMGFCSHIAPDAWRAISYEWSCTHRKFELFLDKAIPNVLGLHSPTPISALLQAFRLCRCDIAHWLVHAGGKKVISAVGEANGLTPHDLRHAVSVLRRYGNLGSPTVIFSYQELLAQPMSSGAYGMMITMGPGATIETSLLRW